MPSALNTALDAYQQSAYHLDAAARQLTPNNPEGYITPLLQASQAETQAQVSLKVIKSWNENIGRLLDILA